VVAVALGLAIGLLSGLFGVGGSSISTPALRVFLHTPQLIALGSPLPVTIPTALVGGFTYNRHGLVNWRIVRWVAMAGVPGIVAGSLLTEVIPAEGLMYLVALALFGMGVQLVRQTPVPLSDSLDPPVETRWMDPPVLTVVALSVVVGVFSGLLANGGGFLLVPALVLLFGARLRQAAATSLPCIALLAIPGTITHASLGHIDGWLVLELAIGVIPMTYIGAFLSLRFQSVRMRRPFGAFLAVFGLYFFLHELL
jgi:uncharacterized membrane protein YfcA